MDFDDIDELEEEFVEDVCPSCGTLLNEYGDLDEECNDPLGCGLLKEDCESDEEEFEEEDLDEEEDEECQELNFED